MKLDKENRTFDCDPTLTDSQVLEFCSHGAIVLEGVVSHEINQQTFEYLDEHPTGEPSTIMLEDWFLENVLLHPEVAGAVRSILGRNVGLPVLMSNHRAKCPAPAQGWHHDGDSVFDPEVNYLQVFYYPQDVTPEMGPTEILPGSHLAPTGRDIGWRGGRLMDSSAGTVFITMYPILHRKSESTTEGMRNMLKWSYWRTVPPQRDWVIEPNFDFHTANYGGHGAAKLVAHKFFWLCGKGDEFRTMGGQSWPYSGSQANQIQKSYGFPSGPPQW